MVQKPVGVKLSMCAVCLKSAAYTLIYYRKFYFRVLDSTSFFFSRPGHPAPGQAYPSSGLPMALSPSGNQPQYNPHSSHSSHQPSLPATNPQYHGNQGMVHSNQVVMTHTNPRPQSARCLLQTKGQKSTDGFQEQVSVCLSICLSVFSNHIPHYLGGLFENGLCSNHG